MTFIRNTEIDQLPVITLNDDQVTLVPITDDPMCTHLVAVQTYKQCDDADDVADLTNKYGMDNHGVMNWGTLTVDLGSYFYIADDEYHVFIKNYSESSGIIDQLIEQNIVAIADDHEIIGPDGVVYVGSFRSECVYVNIVDPALRDMIATTTQRCMDNDTSDDDVIIMY